MTINLFVGDCTSELADHAKKFSADAYLVDFSNFEKFLNLDSQNRDVTAYTSFADLPKISADRAVFYEVLQQADKIYYAPPDKWSDYTLEFSLQNQKQITEYFLYLVNFKKNNVIGIDLTAYMNPGYLNLKNYRSSEHAQLWVSGCSVTAGVGVSDHEKYPSLLADQYNLLWTDLSQPGSSIEFQADQILRSDIQKNDIVLWGLTSEYRATVWSEKNKRIGFLNAHKFDRHRTNQADDVCDETRVYKAITSVKQVINFCNKIEARLILVPILCTEHLQLMLHHEPTYYQLPYSTKPIDIGNDGEHPGVRQHQLYAEEIGKIFDKVLFV